MAQFSTHLGRLILGDRGHADLVVTRSADTVHFRLPNQRCGCRAYLMVLSAASLGAIALALPFGTPFLAIVLIAAYFAWRYSWHYELTLNEKRLRVDCISSWARRTKCVISLAHIGQFTVVRHARTALLQAESSNDETEAMLFDRSADTLERLAQMLSEHHAELAGRTPPIRVAVESPLGSIRTERLLPPLNTRIVLNRQSNGIMLDFPAPPMAEPEPASAQLWRIFLPCVILVGAATMAIVGFVAALGLDRVGNSAAAIFVAVISCTLVSAGIALPLVRLRNELRRSSGRGAGCGLRRLIFTDEVLIRTMLNGGKQVWYRDEIDRICVEASRTSMGGTILWLSLVTKDGEREDLLGAVEDRGVEDYRSRAELEWVATELQRALTFKPADAIVGDKTRPWLAEQIEDRGGYRLRG